MSSTASSEVAASRRPSPEAVALDESGHAVRRFCSWHQSGWRSVLLRLLDNHAVVQDLELAATGDQLLVLVTAGRATIEVADGSRWRRADYVPGRLGMTAPGRSSTLRWRTTASQLHRTLHVYLPGAVMRDVAEQMWSRDLRVHDLPDTLSTDDPLIEATMRAMCDAARAGADDLYAESALNFLAVHLLTAQLGESARPEPVPEDARIRTAIAFMHDNLALPLSLADIAATVDLSVFHFMRLFKVCTGEPPRQFLTGLRVDAARQHLERRELAVSDIAHLCGFSSPSHLAAAFRRRMGMSPTAYRAVRR